MTIIPPLKSTLPLALFAMAIAACLPFDHGLTVITRGNTPAHVLAMGGLALAGGWMGNKAGLNPRGSILVGLCMALAAAAYVLLLDVVLLRPMVPASVVAMAHTPLVGRWAVFMGRAFNENIIYRLFGFSAAMLGLRRLYGERPVPVAMMWLAALLLQGLNIWSNLWLVVDHTPTAAVAAYWSVRYLAPGVVWSWLYWRFGFRTTEIASVGGHLFLQPVFSLLI